jgi:hypothetical protein
VCGRVDGFDRDSCELRGPRGGDRSQGEWTHSNSRGEESRIGPTAANYGSYIDIDVQDIFRRYPHSYEGIIPTLCANLDELDEPEAKASLIWIIGEYAEKIENADELLGTFLEAFKEESYPVSRDW